VQPFGQGVVVMVPPLQVRWLLPSHSMAAPSHATHPLPSALQKRPSPQAAAQQTLTSSAFALHTPEAQSPASVHAAPTRRRQAPFATSHSHSASGRRATRAQSSAVWHWPKARHWLAVTSAV
jgi:hypothetical protein